MKIADVRCHSIVPTSRHVRQEGPSRHAEDFTAGAGNSQERVSGCFFCRVCVERGVDAHPLSGDPVGVFGADPGGEVLTHVAAQLPQRRRILRADEHANSHGVRSDVCDVNTCDFAVPEVRLGEDQVESFAQCRYGRVPIQQDLDGTRQFGLELRPVLERRCRESRARQYEDPPVPGDHDDVTEGDLVDATPLVLDDDDIADPDGFAERELDPGEEGTAEGLGDS